MVLLNFTKENFDYTCEDVFRGVAEQVTQLK